MGQPTPAPQETQHEPVDLDEEDLLDLEDARTALREFQESGEAAIPYAEVRRQLGLP